MSFITYFPDDDYNKTGDRLAYGPFATLEEAKAHARNLSTDPNEGVIREIKRVPGTVSALDTPELQDAFVEGEEYVLRRLAEAARRILHGDAVDHLEGLVEMAGYTLPNEKGEFV